MNDLMTKSFLSYVDLKKQAMKDLEAGPDIEMGQLDPTDERNLSKFFEEVAAIKNDMEVITNLLLDLQDLNEESKLTHSAMVLRGVRDRINSDMVTVLRKAKIIKTRLESLDKSNMENRKASTDYKEGSPVDRTRMSVTNGLRVKLKGLMSDFQCLREKIVNKHTEMHSASVEEQGEKVIGGEKVFEGKQKGEELAMENKERDEAVKEIQRSLIELHQVFLDMAVMVETQGEHMNNIELNVVNAGSYVKDGTNQLHRANDLKKKRSCACWIGVVVLVMLFVCILAILF